MRFIYKKQKPNKQNPNTKRLLWANKMAGFVRVAAKPGVLSLITGPTWWKDRLPQVALWSPDLYCGKRPHVFNTDTK